MKKIKKLFICVRYFYLPFKMNKLKNQISEVDECIVLGNGPSLAESLHKDIERIKEKKKICVNSFANTDYYSIIKPEYYVLADPVFWEFEHDESNSSNKHINMLSEEQKRIQDIRYTLFKSLIEKTSWNLKLFVPLHSKLSKVFENLNKKNNKIEVYYYSSIPINIKCKKIRNFLYRCGIGMPTPQTVLIPAIFVSLKMSFKKIYIIGADHSWHEDIFINENNVLCSKDKHFYGNNTKFVQMVYDAKTNRTTTIGEHFYYTYITFRGHQYLNEYSRIISAVIWNCSSKSYIDAYERGEIL